MPENRHDVDLVREIEELREEVHVLNGRVYAIQKLCAWAIGISGVVLVGGVGWAFSMQQTVTTIAVTQSHVVRDSEKLELAVDELADAVNELAARVGRQ